MELAHSGRDNMGRITSVRSVLAFLAQVLCCGQEAACGISDRETTGLYVILESCDETLAAHEREAAEQ